MNQYRSQKASGWYGWIAFAAAFMIINGLFGLVVGLAALLKDDFVVISENSLVTFNVSAWGWIHIIFAIALIAIGYSLFRGETWATMLSVVIVGLHMVAQFTFLTAYPVWAVVVIALDALILWALIVHGLDSTA
jgi:hypothetical protein